MPNQEIIDTISKSLQTVYEREKTNGFLGVYIWGSVLTQDFNPRTSDIDTIAIVTDDISLDREQEIQQELAKMHPEFTRLGFRFVYKTELDTGLVKSNLGKVGVPELLLLDLPTWYFVCGYNFNQKDFSIPVPGIQDAIVLRYARFANEGWDKIDGVSEKSVQYYIKQILRIIHLKYLLRHKLPYSAFSYTGIADQEDDMSEKNIIDICLKIKASNWEYSVFKGYTSTLHEYVLKGVSV